ncbi:hypothetical protein BDF19DRAFT_445564, partial [Syncephalis fuscata]
MSYIGYGLSRSQLALVARRWQNARNQLISWSFSWVTSIAVLLVAASAPDTRSVRTYHDSHCTSSSSLNV